MHKTHDDKLKSGAKLHPIFIFFTKFAANY